MSKETKKEIKSNNKKRRAHSAGRITIKVIATLMAISMVFAVAATCIFYIQYYM